MTEPIWKRLVDDLTDAGMKNPYLDRLSDRLSAMQMRVLNRGSIQAEIIDEMAFALCKAEDKVNLALLEVDILSANVSDPHDIDAYNDAVERARVSRWEYMVHREAIGLYEHRVLEELFPIPARILRQKSGASVSRNT